MFPFYYFTDLAFLLFSQFHLTKVMLMKPMKIFLDFCVTVMYLQPQVSPRDYTFSTSYNSYYNISFSKFYPSITSSPFSYLQHITDTFIQLLSYPFDDPNYHKRFLKILHHHQKYVDNNYFFPCVIL